MAQREGNLQAPTRHPLDWQSDDFYNEDSLNKELERVFDICHGCRRCVSLCDAFPTLFDLVDESDTFEVATSKVSDSSTRSNNVGKASQRLTQRRQP